MFDVQIKKMKRVLSILLFTLLLAAIGTSCAGTKKGGCPINSMQKY